jgi:PAS domain S-box-containing protein
MYKTYIILITLIIANCNGLNVWAAEPSAESKATRNPLLEHMSSEAASEHLQTASSSGSSFLAIERKGLSEPQWGMRHEEIDYLFEHSQNLVCTVEFGGCLKRINKQWTDTLGWTAEELLRTPYINFVHPDDVVKTLEYEKLFPPVGLVNRYRCKDGSYCWFDWMGFADLSSKERHKGTPLTIGHNITLQKTLEKEILEKLYASKEIKYPKLRVLAAITEIQAVHAGSILEEDSKEFATFNCISQNLVTLSGSDFGFLVEVVNNGQEKAFRWHDWAVSLTATSELKSFFTSSKQNNRKFAIFESFLATVLSSKSPLIINNMEPYAKLIEAQLTPQGLTLKSFLSIPLIIKNKIVGIFSFANCEPGYSEPLIEWLSPLLVVSSQVVDSVQSRTAAIERDRIAASAAAKSSFVAHMSHEIRTPLGGIIGLLDIIDKENLSGIDRDHIDAAEMAAHSLLSIVNDVLDMTKLEAGILRLEEREFNPLLVAQSVVKTLILSAQKKELDLTLKVRGGIPSCLIGDDARFSQILFNLIGNAIKFTEHGSVKVMLDGASHPENKDIFTLRGRVKDTGIGMKENAMERLFTAFYQVDEALLRGYGGSGLGLFISRQICKKMEGDIKATSKVGKGSTFNFRVNLRLKATAGSPLLENKRRVLPKLPPSLRVLMAEDNLMNQKLLKAILVRAGCSDITLALNGLVAVEAINNNTYDVVLMDGEMPEMDGLTATRKIREKFNKEQLPIIGVTAHALATDRDRFLSSGMNGYLTKPLKKEDLIAEILRCLKIQREAPTLVPPVDGAAPVSTPEVTPPPIVLLSQIPAVTEKLNEIRSTISNPTGAREYLLGAFVGDFNHLYTNLHANNNAYLLFGVNGFINSLKNYLATIFASVPSFSHNQSAYSALLDNLELTQHNKSNRLNPLAFQMEITRLIVLP